jgi:hypothetical protein
MVFLRRKALAVFEGVEIGGGRLHIPKHTIDRDIPRGAKLPICGAQLSYKNWFFARFEPAYLKEYDVCVRCRKAYERHKGAVVWAEPEPMPWENAEEAGA